jgi:hypothetical protein
MEKDHLNQLLSRKEILRKEIYKANNKYEKLIEYIGMFTNPNMNTMVKTRQIIPFLGYFNSNVGITTLNPGYSFYLDWPATPSDHSLYFTAPYTICFKFNQVTYQNFPTYWVNDCYATMGVTIRDNNNYIDSSIDYKYNDIPGTLGNMVSIGIITNGNKTINNWYIGHICPGPFQWINGTTLYYDTSVNLNLTTTSFMIKEDNFGNIFYNVFDSSQMNVSDNVWKPWRLTGKLRTDPQRNAFFNVTRTPNTQQIKYTLNFDFIEATI